MKKHFSEGEMTGERKKKAATAPQASEVSGHASRGESEAVCAGEEVARQIVLNGCSSFEELAYFGCLSKHFYELVSTSLESWRLTAKDERSRTQAHAD